MLSLTITSTSPIPKDVMGKTTENTFQFELLFTWSQIWTMNLKTVKEKFFIA